MSKSSVLPYPFREVFLGWRIALVVLLVAICSPTHAQTGSVSTGPVRLTTSGPCSPIVANSSQVTVVCGADGAELARALQTLPQVEALNRQAEAIQSLRRDALGVRAALDRIVQSPPKSIASLTGELSSLRRRLADLRRLEQRIEATNERLAREMATALAGAKEMHADELRRTRGELEAQLYTQARDAALSNLSAVSLQLTALDSRVTVIDLRLDSLESNLSELMRAFHSGQVRDAFAFGAGHVGTLRVARENASRTAIELEMLTPDMPIIGGRGSAFIEVGRLDLKLQRLYTTLPGQLAIPLESDNRQTYLSIGARSFAFTFDSAACYFGGGFGSRLSGPGNMKLFEGLLGCEVARRSSRIGIELRSSIVTAIASRYVAFDAFGEPEVGVRKFSEGALGLSLRIAFR